MSEKFGDDCAISVRANVNLEFLKVDIKVHDYVFVKECLHLTWWWFTLCNAVEVTFDGDNDLKTSFVPCTPNVSLTDQLFSASSSMQLEISNC